MGVFDGDFVGILVGPKIVGMEDSDGDDEYVGPEDEGFTIPSKIFLTGLHHPERSSKSFSFHIQIQLPISRL